MIHPTLASAYRNGMSALYRSVNYSLRFFASFSSLHGYSKIRVIRVIRVLFLLPALLLFSTSVSCLLVFYSFTSLRSLDRTYHSSFCLP